MATSQKPVIRGIILSRGQNNPQAGLRVEAWFKDKLLNDPARVCTTEQKGDFLLVMAEGLFREFIVEKKVQVYFKAFRNDAEILNTSANAERLPEDGREITLFVDERTNPQTPGNETPGTDQPGPGSSKTAFEFMGTVTLSNGLILPAVRVILFELGLRERKKIAETVTDDDGRYILRADGSVKSSFKIEAHSPTGKMLSESPALVNVKNKNIVDLIVDADELQETNQSDRLKHELTKYYRKIAGTSPLTVEDIKIVARESARPEEEVWKWLKANELSDETKIDADFFYALLKQGQPAVTAALTMVPVAELKIALEKAVDSSDVPPKFKDNIDGLLSKWKTFRIERALGSRGSFSGNKLSDILAIVLPDSKEQQALLTAYDDAKKTKKEFWKEAENTLGKNKVEDIQTTLQLTALTGQQLDIVKHFFTKVKPLSQGERIASLAGMTETDWQDELMKLSATVGKSVVPDFIEGLDEKTRTATYAAHLASALEQSFPTQSFFQKLKAAPQTAFEKTKTDLVKFYAINPAFSLETIPAKTPGFDQYEFKDMDKTAVIRELKSVSRISAYTVNFNLINTLKTAQLDSAYAIVRSTQKQFLAKYSKLFPTPSDALMVYKKAEKNYMSAVALWANWHPHLHSTAVTPNAPDLRAMFGSLDACECEHCSSVFSPSAYYADLLYNLSTRAKPVYDELIRRRPDLPHVLLSCKNINTPMPYVDLGIELMESLVIRKTTLPAAASANQTTWEAQELAANPEYLDYTAYDSNLKKAVYPSILPFDLPLEESRTYLRHLGIEKHLLMAHFYGGTLLNALSNFDICMERLLISPAEADIIKGKTTGDGGADNGIWNFYGFDKDNNYTNIPDPASSMAAITSAVYGNSASTLQARVDIFLQQTSLEYKQLLALLLCRCINRVVGSNAAGDPIYQLTITAKATDPAGNAVDPATCELDLLELKGLDLGALNFIHRFVRLSRKLGWTFYELDKACSAFSIRPYDGAGNPLATDLFFTEAQLVKIAICEVLRKKLGMRVEETLAFWSDINSMDTYLQWELDNYPPLPSLYEKLFRNKSVLNPVDPAFKKNPANIDPAALLHNHMAVIIAALEIDESEYSLLVNNPKVVADTKLNIKNLSALFRYQTLAKGMQMSVKDFLSLVDIIGVADIFTDPTTTSDFLVKADAVRLSGFTIAEINYLLRHDFREDTAVAPADDTIGVFLSELRAALRTAKTATQQEQKNMIVQKWSEKLQVSTQTMSRLLLANPLKSTANPAINIIDDFWKADFETDAFLKTYTSAALATEFEPQFVRANGNATHIALPVLFDNYMRLQKIASILNRFKFSETDAQFIISNHATLNCTDITSLPTAVTLMGPAGFERFANLVKLAMAKDGFPIGTPELAQILANAVNTPPAAANPAKALAKTAWMDQLAKRTNWDRGVLESLAGKADPAAVNYKGILNVDFPLDFLNAEIIMRLRTAIAALKKIGLSANLVNKAIQPAVDIDTAKGLKNATKSKYDEQQWAAIAKPLRDDLREKQREALVAYLVPRADAGKKQYWRNNNELYEYLLVDVDMKPVAMTSRIKQWTCSVQLFIDRVEMGIEYPNGDMTSPPLNLEPQFAEEWNEWRKIYRVWQANREIFCYPENYIEEELRDNKTPFFVEMEAQLRQDSLSDENVEEAVRNYVEKLDQVARLEIVGHYHQFEDATTDEPAVDILHVFGRTYAHPHKYFHRTLIDGEWMPWQKVEVDIDSNHIVPVIFNRRLCLFWLIFNLETEEAPNTVDTSETIDGPRKYWKIQIAWSEFKRKKWTPKRISKTFLKTKAKSSVTTVNRIKKKLVLKQYQQEDNLFLWIYPDYKMDNANAFVFADTNSDPFVRSGGKVDTASYSYVMTAGWDEMMYTVPYNDNRFRLVKTMYSPGNPQINVDILDRCPWEYFRLVLGSGELQPLGPEFFFQDTKNTFYATHSFRSFREILRNPVDIDLIPAANTNILEIFGTRMIEKKIPFIDPLDDPAPLFERPELYYERDRYFTTNLGRREVENFMLKRQPKKAAVRPAAPVFRAAGIPVVPGSKSSKMATYEIVNKAWGVWDNQWILRSRYREEHDVEFNTFYHAHVRLFIRQLNKYGIKGLLRKVNQDVGDTMSFEATYQPNRSVVGQIPHNKVEMRYGGVYTQYNFELFFHMPMAIAVRLTTDQRFEEARKWFHFIFNSTITTGGGKERFWQFRPFYEEAQKAPLSLADLLNNESELLAQVEKWMDKPFRPHVIARMRPNAYMKYVVMKYIDNLIAWADQLFRRDTIESINEATNLYILAYKILGTRPKKIPPRVTNKEVSFNTLLNDPDGFNAFANVLVDIEAFIPPSASSTGATTTTGPGSLGQLFYFCVPRNEKLLRYWDDVEDRLFKIRHSMNIEGVVRLLPLFDPPIDPALLVRATAAGLDLSSILNDINSPLPAYRFSYTYQKANELLNDVKALGNALLQALEKRDTEALALLRSTQEQRVLSASLAVKEKQLEDAKELLESSKKALEIAKQKHTYYSTRQFMNVFEQQHLTSVQTGLLLSELQGGASLAGSIMSLLPNLKIAAPTSLGATFGGDNLAAVCKAVSEAMGIAASINAACGTMSMTLGGYFRRMDDWQFQASTAAKEIFQAEKQALSAEIKVAIAEKEIHTQQLLIDNNTETDEFMRNKFTSQQLYDWMVGQIATVYFQSYQLAYDLAKKAEKCFRHELGEYGASSFIQFGYWDSLKKGLESAEKLQLDLRRLDGGYATKNKREREITKSISLLIVNPRALIDLKRNGKCQFFLPEALFDQDLPGHYFRRIKSVALTIPCVAGPYTSINCTVRLLSSVIRKTATVPDYQNDDYQDAGKFETIASSTLTSEITTSSAQNDYGMFEVNFRDERYLPFEGAGAISEWELLLNEEAELRQFDYDSISDVIVTMKYTSREDAANRPLVSANLKSLLKGAIVPAAGTPAAKVGGIILSRPFSLKNEYPTEWYRMMHPAANAAPVMEFEIARKRFPAFTQHRNLKISIKTIRLAGFFNNAEDYACKLIVPGGGAAVTMDLLAGNYNNSKSGLAIALEKAEKFGFAITHKDGSAVDQDEIRDVYLVLEYQVQDAV